MTFAPSPELALTIACCRWPRSTERDAAVRQAASLVDDWDAFERVVSRHRVIPLANDGLVCAGVKPPSKTAKWLAACAAECAVTALHMTRESVRLQRAFEEAAVPGVIIKGVAIGALAYGDPCLKQSWDIDLLTSVDAVSRADGLLSELGYRLHNPSSPTDAQFRRFVGAAIEAEYLHIESGMTLELHWGLSRNRRLLPKLSACSASQLVRLGGAEVRTLADEPLFAYLCAHGARHGWARLKWLADVAAFLSSRDGSAIENLYRSALRYGAGRTAAASLLLCERLFEIPIPSPLASEVKQCKQHRRLESAALYHFNHPQAPTDPEAGFAWRLNFSLLFLAPGPAYVAEELRCTWNHPHQRARYGIALHLLRIPLWLASRARTSIRWSGVRLRRAARSHLKSRGAAEPRSQN